MSELMPQTQSVALPDGRNVVVIHDQGGRVLVTDTEGRAEVEIVLTRDGPVVRVHGARLEMTSAGETSIRSRSLAIETEEGIHLHAGGPVRITGDEFRVKTERSVHLNGETVRLNCTDDGRPIPTVSLPLSKANCCGGATAKPEEEETTSS